MIARGLVVKRIKVYFRVLLLAAMLLVVASVIYMNRSNRVDVWFFKSYESINVVWLLVCTAFGSIAAWSIVLATRGVWRDMVELKRSAAADKANRESHEHLAKLAEAEKRIDQKIKNAINDNDDTR